jgi:glycosyltransferase involved in cell wall biosynthesis
MSASRAPKDGPIRVLQFVPSFLFGGTERQLIHLVRGLDRSRFQVDLACFERKGGLLADADRLGVPVREYPVRRLYGYRTWRTQWAMAHDLRRDGVDIVHAHGFYANGFAVPAARLARTPVVLAAIRDTRENMTPGRKRYENAVCRLADGVVVNAEATRRLLVADGLDPDRVKVIYNGIDLAAFDRLEKATGLRQELGLEADAPLVGVLGRLAPHKGVEHFLDAAAALAPAHPRVRFLVVGDSLNADVGSSTYRQQLERRAADLGLGRRVVFTGFRTDIPAVARELTVSVLTSFVEGLSNVLLESMAAGVPVVATSVSGNPEIVRDGETGFLVPPGDATALASAVDRILRDPELARRLARAGRRQVEERFSLERLIRDTAQLYADALEAARRPPLRRREPA